MVYYEGEKIPKGGYGVPPLTASFELPQNFADPTFLIGQAFSILALILGFISYQQKRPAGIIFFQIATGVAFTIHYFLLGEITGAAVNLINSVLAVFYYLRAKRERKDIITPIILCSIIVAVTLFTWDGWYSIFLLTGIVVINLSLAISDPQKIRAMMYIKSPLCLLYNFFALSIGGVIYEVVVLTSATIGIIRNRKDKSGD